MASNIGSQFIFDPDLTEVEMSHRAMEAATGIPCEWRRTGLDRVAVLACGRILGHAVPPDDYVDRRSNIHPALQNVGDRHLH